MTRFYQWIGLAAVGIAVAGCVPQEKYNALKLDRDRLAEQLQLAANELNAARGEAGALREGMGGIGGALSGKDAMIANLQAQNSDLQRQYDDAMRRLQDALGRAGQTALPEALSNELSAWAQQNPDLVEFDAARGIVKFKSDVTFAVGDAALQANAQAAIARFAQILNSPAAAQYELMVAGHTDNTPVSNPQTKAKGHHDNWYLSAHRAISVAEALMQQRVASNRIAVVGYADQRPVAANVDAKGKAANRRVEVLILPTTVKGSVVQPGTAQPAGAAGDSLNKDENAANARPAINK
ncbi:MAG: OmpA family protein [Phycisphaerales bacterium]|nr:OmpA family protein [Phycisphaerales bacterium]